MKKFYLFFFAAALVLLVSCGDNAKNGNTGNTAIGNATVDSMQVANEQMQQFLDLVAGSMDSIAIQEGYLLTGGPDGKPLTDRAKIMQHIKNLKALLARQHARASELEKSLSSNNSVNAAKIKKIIAVYERQLKGKDAMVAKLSKQVEDDAFNIADLKYTIKEMDRDNYELKVKNEALDETINDQDSEINRAYVKVASKDDLKAAGLLDGGGLFKKKKLDVSQINSAHFDEVDIRNFTSLNIPGKKPKILTQVPTTSYKIEQNSDGTTTLTVLDPQEFWKVSKYLVIQSD